MHAYIYIYVYIYIYIYVYADIYRAYRAHTITAELF